MPNKITYTNLIPTFGFVSPLSRYAGSKVIYYGENNVITFDTYKKTIYNYSPNDRYTIIQPGYEYRPDKMSLDAYGVVDFWWKILEANNMKDIYEFKSGLNISLPSYIY